MEGHAIETYFPYIALVNLVVVSSLLVLLGRYLVRGGLTPGAPGARQNLAEFSVDFFVGKAREMGGREVVMTVGSFLATCFLLILASNVLLILPFPLVKIPPTAYFSIPLGFALCSVIGTLAISMKFNGVGAAIRHLVWPNPLQMVSEVTDVLSLSLRLFGNIGGEYMTILLVTSVVAVGIPLILHAVGLIPVFVQALVFTLLTASFIGNALGHQAEHAEGAAAHD